MGCAPGTARERRDHGKSHQYSYQSDITGLFSSDENRQI
jgi:hypothetical protein